jgi:thiol-disulfide isomerase/thioredoxin
MKTLPLFLLLFVINTYSQKELPDISLNNVENKSISLKKEFSKENKIYVFSFWATWCGPCMKELDAISDVYDTWKKELDVEVIAVATDDSRTMKRVKPLLNGKGWEYSVLLDSNQELKRSLSISNIPYTVVVKNGKIVHVQNGYVPGEENELFEKLKKL